MSQNLEQYREWLRQQAPAISDIICSQLAALQPVEIVPRQEGVYVERIANAAAAQAAAFLDSGTGTRYWVAVWPGHKEERRLRLYFTLQTGETFLVDRSMKEAIAYLRLDPPLPNYVKRAADEYIRRHIPQAELERLLELN